MLRRLLLLVGLLALWPTLAGAQTITHVGSLGGGGTAVWADSTETFTLGYTPAAGDLTCMAVAVVGTSVTTTGLNGTWVRARQEPEASGDITVDCTRNGTGTGNQITVALGAADGSANVRWVYWTFRQSGGAGFDAVDQHVNSSGVTNGTSPHSSGSTTPDDANNVCMGFIKGSSGAYTTEAGWTDVALNDNARGAAGYLIQTSATAQSFDPTTAANEDRAVVIVCVDSPAGGGGGGAVPKGTVVGVLP